MDEPGRWRRFARALWRGWTQHNLIDAAAALTFYGILALFPFVLLIVSAASRFIRPDQLQALGDALARVTPPALSPILLARLAELASRPQVGLLTFSALTAVWSSTTGVACLVTALNSAYGVQERRPQWKVYTLALAVTFAAAALAVLAALLALAVPIWQPLSGWLRMPVAAFLMMIVWATIYYVLPNVRHPVRSILPGSVAGVLVWLAATLGFSLYVSHFGTFGITYGALGGIAILLIWMWLSALALMLGAEINAVLRR
ncbi:MAG: YihY/virulence factor BrkB family protein [Myxococcales bacterium]